MSTQFECYDCHTLFPIKISHICPVCGGSFGISGSISYDPKLIDATLPGIWKYRHSFGLPENARPISLGEGNTPLIKSKIFNSEVFFKTEYQNPTGSFKDRLTSPEISYLKSLGINYAVDDSSGNAGASFAAYSRRANIKGKVFVPANASGPKRKQISAYGVKIVEVDGPRSAASTAVLEAINEGATYASHAYLPQGIPGLATIAYELVEQLEQPTGSVIAPVGHGSLLLGIIKGFEALLNVGIIERFPNIIGVQAKECAPIFSKNLGGQEKENQVKEGETLAEGVRVLNPVHGDQLIKMAEQYPIEFVDVEENKILKGRDELAALGFYVELTSAIVWDALKQTIEALPKPIVVILTGSGLKS
ncbi:MAG: pyridoxal-phosphate dependent enzyme [Chloroflexi bacterium]|jgi:threonine synthase|nr:pyridoxal-phosphate dependent enzyme [Chloroflexota bacterium]MBT3669376.1 pyridoxal-phosphate dependent enzyme [Chloroflexota bacterium]MBT4001828.1 pyridoxal-phosphate dependent enzyme [Chloroflexota bacterium]MBT4304605.1 pyridoxal-phosphate dependent enzyme [Chloroflexota bacterium]MBT4534054.1 pyridoxal-phosphate dependent enzyme [Chloroflexota bacterium]